MARDKIRVRDLERQSARQQENETASQTVTESAATEAPVLNARQNAVLRMQQTQGNAAVRRMMVQRATAGEDGGKIDDDVTSRINSARGGGQTLDTGIVSRMGESMGADFSGVKVHTDGESDTLNQQLGAKAFTTGQDIFFQQGAYQPSSSEGQHLLAHELTHVVQQGGSAPSGPLTLGPAHDSYEAEADNTASQVTSALPAVQRAATKNEEEDAPVQAMRDVQRESDADCEDCA